MLCNSNLTSLLNTDPNRRTAWGRCGADSGGMEGTWLQLVRSCALHLLQWFPISETEAEVKSKSNGAVRSLKLKDKASRNRIIVTINI